MVNSVIIWGGQGRAKSQSSRQAIRLMFAAATAVAACTGCSVGMLLELCGVCWQDGSGRVDLETLKDGELDYGCDQAGLAELRQRTKEAVHNYEGAPAVVHDRVK